MSPDTNLNDELEANERRIRRYFSVEGFDAKAMQSRHGDFLTFRAAAEFARDAAMELGVTVRVAPGPDGWWWTTLLPTELDDSPEQAFHIEEKRVEESYDGLRPYDDDYDEEASERFKAAVRWAYSKPASQFVEYRDDLDVDDGIAEIYAEQDDYAFSMARSEEDGWFYQDCDDSEN